MLKGMKAGRMDRRVTLRKRSVSRNAYGEQVATFSDLATVWAEKLDIAGREYFSAQQVQASVTTRWRIRWRDDVTVLDRISYDGAEHDIKNIAELGRRQGLEILTEVAKV